MAKVFKKKIIATHKEAIKEAEAIAQEKNDYSIRST